MIAIATLAQLLMLRSRRMKAFRGEILSVPDDPAVAGAEAIRHFEDGLLVVEDGLVVACGPYADSPTVRRRRRSSSSTA